MLQKLKNKIIRYMPVSQKTYAKTFLSLIKIIEAQKEAEMFIRNDLWQLSKAVNEMGHGHKSEELVKKKDESSMYG